MHTRTLFSWPDIRLVSTQDFPCTDGRCVLGSCGGRKAMGVHAARGSGISSPPQSGQGEGSGMQVKQFSGFIACHPKFCHHIMTSE